VIAAILCFPLVLRIEFKSAEQLKLQPKTHEEHLATQNESEPDDDEDDEGPDIESEGFRSDVNSNDYTRSRRGTEMETATASTVPLDSSIDLLDETRPAEIETIELSTLAMHHSVTLDRIRTSLTTFRQPIGSPIEEMGEFVLDRNRTRRPDELSISAEPPIFRASSRSSISLTQRFYEFYNAPITKFWYNALFYLVFLFLFTYMILIQTPSKPSIPGQIDQWNESRKDQSIV
jgi:hypothetical protein